jgi:flagellar assembly protein FliH
MANNNSDLYGKVTNYEFRSFATNEDVSGKVRDFEFQDVGTLSKKQEDLHEKIVKVERHHADKSDFQISPIVREHRGMNNQVLKERESRIEEEVKKRISAIKEQAYREGFDEGVQNGREEIISQSRVASEEKLQSLTSMIVEVLDTKADLLVNQKKQIYSLVRVISKWIVLKELKDDGTYIERLLEKLIVEMQTKTNLLIHVDQLSFEQMPDVLQTVQEKVGELSNVRVEIDYDIEGPGIVLECDKGILNGTLVEQMKSLDKLFESVGLAQDEPISADAINHEEIADKLIESSLEEVNSESIEDSDSDSEES